MSLRARYQRYRRYGLDPLPADATREQREARVSELRTLRRRRQRTVALRSGIGTLALVVVVALLLYWLLMTIGGRDLLLRQIVARLPAGTELTWDTAEGPASGPMVLRGAHFSMPRQRDPDCVPTARASCAMGRIVFDAQQVTLDPAIRPLLGRTLRLDTLDIVGATLDLPRSDKPFELPRWPDVLPRIEPPLALRADTIRIDGLKVVQEGEALIDIRSARGGLDAAPGSLHIEHLLIDSDRGRFTVHGDYIPRDNFRSDLLATAVLSAPAGRTAPRFGLLARGDLSTMDVSIGGRAPAPLRAILTLRGDGDRPRWQLRANTDALDTGLLSGSGEASTPLAFNLTADGIGGSANLRGNVKQGDFAATLQPSKLRLEDRVLQLQPLVLDVFGGRVTANGTADLRDAGTAATNRFPIRMAVNARGLRWQGEDGTAVVGGDADFGIAGVPDKWAVKGQARLQRGQERATVDVTGNGFRDRMQVTALRASMPQGRLDASGEIAWSPRLSWTAKATLAGFDPGYFAPDWPGAVNGTVLSSGVRRDNGSLLADVEASNLGGTLRGRALRGRGTLNIDGDNYAGDVALSLGGSRIDARGKIASNIDIDANLSPLQLNDLLPDGRGSVRGRLKLRGARNAPDIDVDLRGDGVAFGEYRAERFVAKGRLPWRNGNGMLVVDAQGLQLGLPLDSLRAGLRGSVEVGSSRVDLQACKLEYSIVSPK